MMQNEMVVRFRALSQNESFARVTAGAFSAQLNPTIGELADIKTAVSEAVTNAIVHGYGTGLGMVELRAMIRGNELILEIRDEGKGIADVEQARLPFFTTCPEQDRAGMGFTVMETFMDTLEVESAPGKGTRVRMTKQIGLNDEPEAHRGAPDHRLSSFPQLFTEEKELSDETFAVEDKPDPLLRREQGGGKL